jgi:hypothetical protein
VPAKHQKVNLDLTREADTKLSHYVDLNSQVTLPTECSHYASQKPGILIRDPFEMNFHAVKPCAVIKGIKWLRLIGKFYFVGKIGNSTKPSENILTVK